MVGLPVKTPCIGVCSTGIGDTVCRGCKRFSHEVIAWNGYSQDERRAVLQRIDLLLKKIVGRWLVIRDENMLSQQLKAQQIGFDAARAPESWVVELLKAGASQIDDLALYGLAFTEQADSQSIRNLRDVIDKEFYDLSCAHYERYFHHAPLQ
ncbi:MAG TPA: DUF1289 domain-containing protein [Pseudomonadales bacterium]|jgi:hypothetical protein|nr:DUF1289 domain-containing protein [Pseudomonadales bacterium]HNI36792.1 DUF1289 domain-containing protein [Pseudomonadales bacterium]HNL92659.1 DUF1289 domain-containing protein [Pseudomonadales bacterium]HNN86438.1 DUF1289 domain-containing protein [Pseudomonadales bacterium]